MEIQVDLACRDCNNREVRFYSAPNYVLVVKALEGAEAEAVAWVCPACGANRMYGYWFRNIYREGLSPEEIEVESPFLNPQLFVATWDGQVDLTIPTFKFHPKTGVPL